MVLDDVKKSSASVPLIVVVNATGSNSSKLHVHSKHICLHVSEHSGALIRVLMYTEVYWSQSTTPSMYNGDTLIENCPAKKCKAICYLKKKIVILHIRWISSPFAISSNL